LCARLSQLLFNKNLFSHSSKVFIDQTTTFEAQKKVPEFFAASEQGIAAVSAPVNQAMSTALAETVFEQILGGNGALGRTTGKLGPVNGTGQDVSETNLRGLGGRDLSTAAKTWSSKVAAEAPPTFEVPQSGPILISFLRLFVFGDFRVARLRNLLQYGAFQGDALQAQHAGDSVDHLG
jgi:hypothetical protein